MRKNEHGYIVVETVCAFIPFVLLVVSILSLVNIVALQARVHYALTQAAKTLSVYSYVLEITGIANELTTLSNKAYKPTKEAAALRQNVNSLLDGIESLSGISRGEASLADPQAALGQLMSFTVNDLRSSVFSEMVRPLVGRYLLNGEMTGDEYLRSVRVVNSQTGATGLNALEFYQLRNMGLGNSELIDKDGNIRLTVEYEVEYRFGVLPLPFRPTLRITQTAVTKAWLNGSGPGYW